jgi:hypothetical protein
MPTIRLHPNNRQSPHDQHSYSIMGEDGTLRGPFGPFSLDELRQEFSTLGLGPSDIQNFLDQIGPAGNRLELEIPTP